MRLSQKKIRAPNREEDIVRGKAPLSNKVFFFFVSNCVKYSYAEQMLYYTGFLAYLATAECIQKHKSFS